MPLSEKMDMADYVIDNNGDSSETAVQVRVVYDNLNALNDHWWIRGAVVGTVVLIGVLCFLIIKLLV